MKLEKEGAEAELKSEVVLYLLRLAWASDLAPAMAPAAARALIGSDLAAAAAVAALLAAAFLAGAPAAQAALMKSSAYICRGPCSRAPSWSGGRLHGSLLSSSRYICL
jgi:hypothetical protein